MACARKLFLLIAVATLVALVSSTHSKPKHKTGKGRKKGRHTEKEQAEGIPPDHAPPKMLSPDSVLRANSFSTEGSKDYTLIGEYEQSLQNMVAKLRNNTEAPKDKCEVNLRQWSSNKRSLSPWVFSINHDETRIPVDIPEARCLCVGCINPFTLQEDRTMSTIPIYGKIPVKRLLCPPVPHGQKPHRKKKRCHPEYQTVMENIVIGCTCIF